MLAYIDKLSAIIQDPKATQRLYDAWCSHSGVGHLRYFPPVREEYVNEPDNEEYKRKCALIRNLHTCEAHGAMITRTAHLMYKGRIQEAAESYPELLELQKMPL